MAKWLRAIDSEVWWALFGFLLAFGFGYQWGFASYQLATPVAFLYLVSLETHIRTEERNAFGPPTAWAVFLFFSHGITFGVTVTAGALRCLCGPPEALRTRVQSACHLLPASLVMAAWLVVHGKGNHAAGGVAKWPPSTDRIVDLFSGWWSASPSYWPSVVALACLGTLAWVGQVKADASLARWVPLGCAAAGWALLPEWLSGTWLVGTRMVSLVHAFVPAIARPSAQGARLRAMRWGCAACTAVGLFALHGRLTQFDRETDGLKQLAELVPPGADLRGLVTGTDPDSSAFGHLQLGQAAAWVTAMRGGFLENDFARYSPLPLTRRVGVPWPRSYPYLLARGSEEGTAAAVQRIEPAFEQVSRRGKWVLYRTRQNSAHIEGMEIVRVGQDWGTMQVNAAVTGSPLSIGGAVFEVGLGTHARSQIHVRLASEARSFEGWVGVDDSAPGTGSAIFQIVTMSGAVLFDSSTRTRGANAISFSVPVAGAENLLLRVGQTGEGIDDAHADWAGIRIRR